jgi:mannose-6-phosphate isomerase-like protein (cupin superfamily)
LTSSTLAEEMRAYTGLFTEKTFDWDAFPASRGIPDLSRAQLRYVGAGGSPKVGDPSTMKAQHFTFSLVNQPVGKFAASHAHEVVEHFFILQGVLTVGTVWGDEVVEVKLGPKDLLLNKSGRPHGFRNDGVEPVLMQITVGSGTPEMPVHVCHPKDKELELSRRFGAPGPEKIHLFSPESSDRRHKELAPHVVRYRDRKPQWEKAGFARMAYVGEGGAPATSYSMDMIHLPRGVAIKPYVREVEDVYFVLAGAITIGWEQGGEIVERRLGERDLMFNPAGRAHYFRNDGAADAQFTMVMGSPKPQPVAFEAA